MVISLLDPQSYFGVVNVFWQRNECIPVSTTEKLFLQITFKMKINIEAYQNASDVKCFFFFGLLSNFFKLKQYFQQKSAYNFLKGSTNRGIKALRGII